MTQVSEPTRAIATSLEDLIGNTPLVRMTFPDVPESVRLFAKLEMLNPLSSVKDRPALYMIREAERAGHLPATGGTVIETSSGSMGISLAAMAAMRGHACIIVMPDNATEERRQILRAFGAEVVTVPASLGLPAAFAHAEEIQRSIPGSWLAHQDQNTANPISHYETTGPEIWDACGGDIDVLVCGVGTGGTISGVARYLKERRNVHVVGAEPATSALLSGGEHSAHEIYGIGGGFIADVTDRTVIDEVMTVTDEQAHRTTREIVTTTGLFVGPSSGAAAFASRAVARRPEWAGASIVTIFPDTGERYLSVWSGLYGGAER
jgi:cysteine synthase A